MHVHLIVLGLNQCQAFCCCHVDESKHDALLIVEYEILLRQVHCFGLVGTLPANRGYGQRDALVYRVIREVFEDLSQA